MELPRRHTAEPVCKGVSRETKEKSPTLGLGDPFRGLGSQTEQRRKREGNEQAPGPSSLCSLTRASTPVSIPSPPRCTVPHIVSQDKPFLRDVDLSRYSIAAGREANTPATWSCVSSYSLCLRKLTDTDTVERRKPLSCLDFWAPCLSGLHSARTFAPRHKAGLSGHLHPTSG